MVALFSDTESQNSGLAQVGQQLRGEYSAAASTVFCADNANGEGSVVVWLDDEGQLQIRTSLLSAAAQSAIIESEQLLDEEKEWHRNRRIPDFDLKPGR